MEQAVFISKTEHLKYCDENFTRLYFGNEFCERLIPSRQELQKVLAFVNKRKLSFTFVTPYVTNQGLRKIEKLLVFLAEKCPQAEIVFNDWGVFHFLREKELPIIPVLGRLLLKMKRGPRIMNIIDKVPEETRRYYQTPSLTVPEICTFLKQNRIFRVELDNLLQGIDLDGADKDIHSSLYLPFAFISTTRFCLTANCEDEAKKKYVGVFPCNKECQRYTFTLTNPVMTLPLVRKGNTSFFMNDTLPEVVTRQQVDRIVIEPEIPL
jgi:hypothetical protein